MLDPIARIPAHLSQLISMLTSKLPRATVLAAVLVGALAGPSTAQIVVNSTADTQTASDGQCTLREAINNVNDGSDTTSGDCATGDVITFAASTNGAPIVVTGATGDDANASGDFDILVDVIITGNGPEQTIISGGDIDRVFHVVNGSDATVVFEHLEVREGLATDNSGGGGMRLAGRSHTLRDCRIVDNHASVDFSGGGVYFSNTDSSLLVERCDFVENTAGGKGGGLDSSSSDGNLNVYDSSFLDNEAEEGGGVELSMSDGTARFERCAFRGNQVSIASSSSGGGGLANNSSNGQLELLDVLFDSNHAPNGSGGGLVLDGGASFLRRATLTGNTALENGGGVVTTDVATLVQVTISGNSAGATGGGIWVGGRRALLLSSTLTLNEAGTGGDQVAVDNFDRLSFGNSVLGDATGDAECLLEPDAIVGSLGYNLINGVCPGVIGDTGKDISADPLLEALADNGGFAPTHLPTAGSPTLDAADPAGCSDFSSSSFSLLEFDQRGVARIADSDDDGVSRCDIGAVERREMLPLEGQYCRSESLDVPDQGLLVSGISVPDSLTVDDVNVRMVLDHPDAGQLLVRLEHGTTKQRATLLDQPNSGSSSCTGWNAALVFDDEAMLAAQLDCNDAATAFVPSQNYQPAESLDVFDGLSAEGEWYLTVRDREPGITGRFLGWCLEGIGEIFSDGFESGNTDAWSSTTP